MLAPQLSHVLVVVIYCHVQRRLADLGPGIDLGVMGEEEFHHVLVAPIGGLSKTSSRVATSLARGYGRGSSHRHPGRRGHRQTPRQGGRGGAALYKTGRDAVAETKAELHHETET